jgi:phage baseplate assembly protein W
VSVAQPDAGTREFLGAGMAFPPRLTSEGAVAMSGFEAHVAESVHLILATARGERVMRPDWGSGLSELAFASMDAATVALARHLVEDGLQRCEPRIDVLGVDVEADHPLGLLTVRVSYRVRRTDTVFNLVYPFSLERGRHADA